MGIEWTDSPAMADPIDSGTGEYLTMRWVSADTTSDAMAKEFEVLRGMDVSRRAAITFELSDNLRQIVEAGIRHRNPCWDDQAVKREVMRLMLGEHLFHEIFGNTRSTT